MSHETSETVSTNNDRGERIGSASLPPDWLIRIVNPVLTRLLRSPLHGLVSDRLMLLTVIGRTSGTAYTFPVLYERENRTVYVTSHGTTWWKNLRDGGKDVILYLRGERRTGYAKITETNRAVAEYAHNYLQRHGTDAADKVGLDLPDEEVPSVEALEPAVDHIVLITIELCDS